MEFFLSSTYYDDGREGGKIEIESLKDLEDFCMSEGYPIVISKPTRVSRGLPGLTVYNECTGE